jgi:hypothetical protein
LESLVKIIRNLRGSADVLIYSDRYIIYTKKPLPPTSGCEWLFILAAGQRWLSHGGSAFKLIDKAGNRIETLSSEGVVLRLP